MSVFSDDEEKNVYLAGHIDAVDDPTDWRELVKMTYKLDGVNWIDPYDKAPGYGENPSEVVRWCLDQARECDGILIGKWYPEVKTRGTMREMHIANFNGRPVVLVHDGDPKEISPFVHDCVTAIVKDMDNAVDTVLYQIDEVRRNGRI